MLARRILGRYIARLATSSGRQHRLLSAAASKAYEFIVPEKLEGGVAKITLNRPKALNALCEGLIAEINTACNE